MRRVENEQKRCGWDSNPRPRGFAVRRNDGNQWGGCEDIDMVRVESLLYLLHDFV